MAKKTPEQWAQDIERIKDIKVRGRVARIVWWDHFGSRKVKDRWPHLDKYVVGPILSGEAHKENNQGDSKQTLKELVNIGYINTKKLRNRLDLK